MASALAAVTTKAVLGRAEASARWDAIVGSSTDRSLDAWSEGVVRAGRITLNFHPDRVTRSGSTVAAGLLAEGRYRSQWVTGISNGSRSALTGGDRHRFERDLFDGAYDGADPPAVELPVYGALDLLDCPFGGSPRFGSSFVVLHPHMRARTTLCVGDSHLGPPDVGTVAAPWCLLAGLVEQASAGRLLDRPLGVVDLLTVLDGDRSASSAGRTLDGYLEAQVHGGVDLATDVEAIVVDPSFAGTAVERDLSAAATRYGIDCRWHPGSELAAGAVPPDFRGPTVVGWARRVARPDGVVDAQAIGAAAPRAVADPHPGGDEPDTALQQLKYLWHAVFALGHDAESMGR